MSFADEVMAAVGALGGAEGEQVVDFLADPGSACHAVDALPEGGALVVRTVPETGPAAAGFGPAPVAPRWIRVVRGTREVGTAALRGPGAAVRRAERIEIDEREERCCEAPGCNRRRACASAWLVLEPPGEPGRLLIAEERRLVSPAETLPATPDDEPDAVRAAAVRLATAIGVPLRRGGEEAVPDPASPLPQAIGDAPGVAALARFALHREGDLRVLRDWDSAGPRASAVRNGWIGGVLLVGAVVAWAALAGAVATGGAGAPAAGVVAGLLTLAGYAFVGVARFSARYRAPCAALVAVGNDRIVVLPWVARDGAVDLRPEGRLGAAIALGEVRGTSPRPIEHGVAVEIATDHGPIDALVSADAAAANLWCAVLARVVDEARHPRPGGTARQRARQRAAAA